MNGAHIAGGGLGALVGAALAWAAHKYLGIDLSRPDAALVGGATLSVGAALGHVWATTGLVPAVRQGLFGPPVAVAPQAPPQPSPTPQPPQG